MAEDEAYAGNVVRWSRYSAPTFQAVVQVTSEQDVQAVVKWANKRKIPFLPYGGGHGINGGIGKVQNGIQISFAKMKDIKLSEDGKSASVQPGLHSGELVRGLFALNKRTTTGTCLCTGIVGPLLGGGHGLLQGQYGLLADQLLEARLVLADGSAITVSETENKDLFWGIRGAGHNFGILTAAKLKVYDQPARNWTYQSIAYPGVMAAKVFEASNELNAKMPAELSNFIVMRRIPQMNPNNSVILSNFFFDGPPEELKKHLAGFAKVPQMFNMTKTGNYPDIYTLGMSHEASPQCIGNNFKNLMGVELDKYNPAVQKKIYDVFNEFTADPRFALSSVLYDNYGRQGMLAVPEESTAIKFRKSWVDVTPAFIYFDPSVADIAVAKAKEIRDLFQNQDGPAELNAYVNYSFGDEPMEAVYGREQWRLDKLRNLKKKYDPTGKFNYFSPITYES